ncbi:HPP family protein [Indioceanicola profundi]|uniref:HPP family protein n=1 Tax=Indioceanicola profundi TaxID=2220096 RepID=UPI000E6A95A1|nr:HPP family protein [Indioceanicola profundi]
MPRRFRYLLVRHEERPSSFLVGAKQAVGGGLAIATIGGLAGATELPLLLAPFGATSVILFSAPASPFAQPINVLVAYVLATLTCLLFGAFLPPHWLVAASGVAVVMLLMALFRTTHPPAGAIPILLLGGTPPEMLLKTVPPGALCLVLVAILYHALPPSPVQYPRR